MIKKILLILFLGLSFIANAQIHDPLKWKYTSRSSGVGEAELVFTATIEKNWHVYSQFIESGGPVPTSFNFTASPDYTLDGKVKEASPVIKTFDKTFNMNIAYFADKAVFIQKIKLKKPQVTVKGVIGFMLCNAGQCLPPDEHAFSISVKDDKVETDVVTDAKKAVVATTSTDTLSHDTAEKKDSVAVKSTITNTGSDKLTKNAEDDQSLWTIFLAGFVGGFAAFLMPCIFPMVPFTISFFTKRSSKGSGIGKVLIYAASIIVIYVGLGLLVSILFGADALNALSTDGIFNFAFFLLLVVFAASFLGAFEISLPEKWVNKVDSQSDRSGLLSIFFMAATLALVSFSCTGPIIGTLLVQAASMGEYMGPAIGMFGFAVALSIPFTLFAMFPSLLKSMPKSGGWLNSVKVVLGFLELALALKFLSNVDLAYHWNWFDREVFLVLWIVIFGMLGFYLLGKLRFPHDSEVKALSIPRLFLSIIVLSFTIYMIPGLWGAPLRSISAFLPPQQTQDFDLYSSTLGNNKGSTTNKEHQARKYSDKFHAPLNLDSFFDYDEGMEYAKKVKKPVILDFTGHACVNCRKMESNVWSRKQVLDILTNDYVVIQLYVDDKTSLPESEQYVSKFSGKNIRTIGNKWSDFQASRYNVNSQPYYILLDNNGNLLVKPEGANYNADEFATFLKAGVEAYKAGSKIQ